VPISALKRDGLAALDAVEAVLTGEITD
jgi:hypothetical protein